MKSAQQRISTEPVEKNLSHESKVKDGEAYILPVGYSRVFIVSARNLVKFNNEMCKISELFNIQFYRLPGHPVSRIAAMR